MRSSNPVLGRAFGNKRGYAAFEPRSTDALEEMYSSPSASPLQTGRMTMDDVVARTGFLFAILVAVGGAAWTFNVGFGVAMIALLGAFGLSLVISFSKTVRPALVVAYAGLEGLAIGAISRFYNDAYPGIVSQAVIGTLAAFVGVLALYRSGRLRATPQFTRILMGALIGYLVLGIAKPHRIIYGRWWRIWFLRRKWSRIAPRSWRSCPCIAIPRSRFQSNRRGSTPRCT